MEYVKTKLLYLFTFIIVLTLLFGCVPTTMETGARGDFRPQGDIVGKNASNIYEFQRIQGQAANFDWFCDFDNSSCSTIASLIAGSSNTSWNQTLADTLYADISVTSNNTFNQTLTDSLYSSNWKDSGSGAYIEGNAQVNGTFEIYTTPGEDSPIELKSVNTSQSPIFRITNAEGVSSQIYTGRSAITSANDTIIQNSNDDDIQFVSDGSFLMTIKGDTRYVGINTTNPVDSLHVVGPFRVQGDGTIFRFVNSSNNTKIWMSTSSDEPSLYLRGKDGIDNIRLSSAKDSYILDSEVGIGTTTPHDNLEIYDSQAQILLNGTQLAAVRFFDNNVWTGQIDTGEDEFNIRTYLNNNINFRNLSNILMTLYGINGSLYNSNGFEGDLTGNSDTATALFSNGANCAAGSYPLGVDASGAVESCTDASTEIVTANSSMKAYVDATDTDTTYTAGDALTLTGTDFDFDGGASPAGELGGTWGSPTVDGGIFDDEYIELGDTFGGEVSGTYGAITLSNSALDDAYIELGDTFAGDVSGTYNAITLDCSDVVGTGLGCSGENLILSLTPTVTTLNTGQGANELYDMDQNVLTTSDVQFQNASLSEITMDNGCYSYTNSTAWVRKCGSTIEIMYIS